MHHFVHAARARLGIRCSNRLFPRGSFGHGAGSVQLRQYSTPAGRRADSFELAVQRRRGWPCGGCTAHIGCPLLAAPVSRHGANRDAHLLVLLGVVARPHVSARLRPQTCFLALGDVTIQLPWLRGSELRVRGLLLAAEGSGRAPARPGPELLACGVLGRRIRSARYARRFRRPLRFRGVSARGAAPGVRARRERGCLLFAGARARASRQSCRPRPARTRGESDPRARRCRPREGNRFRWEAASRSENPRQSMDPSGRSASARWATCKWEAPV